MNQPNNKQNQITKLKNHTFDGLDSIINKNRARNLEHTEEGCE